MIRCINELFLISLSPPDIVVCAIWALKVDWSDINFSERWQLYHKEVIHSYSVVIISDEPVDIDRILRLGQLCPRLGRLDLMDSYDSLLGVTEFNYGHIHPDELPQLLRRLENSGFTLDLSPRVDVVEYPVFLGGRPLGLDVTDPIVRDEMIKILREQNVPLTPVNDPPMRIPMFGDRNEVIVEIKSMLDYKPRVPPDERPPKWTPQDPPTFRYIDESILSAYARHDWCSVCDAYTNVFFLLGTVILNGKEESASRVCVLCLRSHEYREDGLLDSIRRMLDRPQQNDDDVAENERDAQARRIMSEYLVTPKLPNFCQCEDWPFCCGDFTQFIGDAGETYHGSYEGFEWWGDEGDGAVEYGIEGMMGGEDSVSLFQCPRCRRKYWTFQCT